jgi:hypothetical protein
VKRPPNRDQILEIFQLVTPASYHQPFIDDPGGAIAQWRGTAKGFAETAKVIGRSASRQFFTAPPGFESAGPGIRATQTITVRRTGDLGSPLVIAAGALTTEGPRGRVYRSIREVRWLPFDPEPIREIDLACELIGEPGNLDFMANDDGYLVAPDGSPGLRIVDIQDVAQGRSGIKGRLAPGPLAQLSVGGSPPTFSPQDVGLYLRINSAAVPANVGRVLRIVDWALSTSPGPTGDFPRTITLDDGPVPALVVAAIQDDGGVFTDYTAEAQGEAAGDVVLLPTVPAIGDAFYFGGDAPFGLLELEIEARRYGDLTVVWEYWNGAWLAVPGLQDGTEGFTIEGLSGVLIPTIPGDWTSTTINGSAAFFLRARVATFVNQTQQPLGSRAVSYAPDPLLSDPLDVNGDGQIGWTILDWRTLGLEVLTMTAPAGGRDDDLGLKLAERQVARRPGESIRTLARRASRFPDVVTPERLEWEVDRLLNPYGLSGQICDYGKGFSGTFWDVPVGSAPQFVCVWDMYEPGALFPEDQTFLPLDEATSSWHFFLKLPLSGIGDFGCAWDDGPIAFWPSLGAYLGPAWDACFFDGYPWTAGQLNLAVVDRVNEVKAAGISFTVIQAAVPSCSG